MEKVLVLLSTYNGEKFLEKQLQSLKNQVDIDVNILVRDDGSTDKTINILKKWENDEGVNLKWYKGKNLKSAKSFMDLVYKAQNYDYYAYCDQDDVWDNDKLKIAVKEIKKFQNNKETLYCSTLRIVDENLNKLKINNIERLYSLGESLIRNNVTGCTMVFNKKLLETLKMYKAEYIEMHDSWTYKVCLCVEGNVILDKNPHISYRQHENNVIGATIGKKNKFNKRLKTILSRNNNRYTEVAQQLIYGYSNVLSQHNKNILYDFVNYNKSFGNKIRIIKNKHINKGKKYQKILFALDVLLENL